jgi:hypothetical protein
MLDRVAEAAIDALLLFVLVALLALIDGCLFSR